MFEGKNILLISPSFFNYEVEIAKKLQQSGAIVDFFDDRPSNTPLAKAMMRVKNPFKSFWVNFHYDKILKYTNQKKYDFFLLIKGEVTPGDFLKKLRLDNQDTKFIYYSYDSVFNNSNAIMNLSYFDSRFSFDSEDVVNYPSFRFRPLFYLNDYATLKGKDPDIDLLFIGTAHTDRYVFVKKVVEEIQSQANKVIKLFLFFYLHGKLLFYFNKFTNQAFSGISVKEVSFEPLRKQAVLDLVDRSKCIIDIQHPNQTGLTMRTIECLGARKKLISTNKRIIEYDFYNSNNICVVDRDNPKVPLSFVEGPYQDINIETYNSYSIDSWVTDVFG